MSVLLETSLGEIVIDLLTEDCPKASLNFLKLCKIKYYNFCTFHNVQKDFMCQTGDPTGSGKGGESIFHIVDKSKPRYFKPEFHPKLKHSSKGTVSMAISSSQTSSNGDSVSLAGSQFFITLNENLDYLDGKYAVFGVVAEGLEILEKINDSYCDESGKSYRDIRIKHTFILEDPFDDPEGLEVPEHSPEPSAELLNTLRLAEDEELEPNLPPEELEKITREREARAQALTLEMVGDLPFADVKPPENVLFVCKLNPITRGEDLELIFSRFGPIASCEIIRDVKTGDSLSYAFVEFENQKDCEEAYFKMDNVLIDDRRIHVDFSQSVSKLNKGFMFSEFQKMKSNASENSSLEIRDKYKNFDQGSSREKLKYGMMFEHKSDKYSRDDSGRNQSKNNDYKSFSKSHFSKEKDNDRCSRNYDRHRDTRRERTPERIYKGSSRHRSRSPRRRY